MSLENSNQLFERCIQNIPTASQTFSKSKMQYPSNAPMFLESGKGSLVQDIDGNTYVDTVNALQPIILGYCDPDVDRAIKKQLEKGIVFSMPSPVENSLAEMLIDLIPSAEMVRFGKTGSDATSAAVRIARAYTGKDKIISIGYHGWHDWYIVNTVRNKGIPASLSLETIKVSFNDLGALNAELDKHSRQVAGIIIEPYCITQPIPGYLEKIREICSRQNIILIFDEIVTGFRQSIGGAQKYYGVTPDLSCFGKAMANGMPISAVVGNRELMKLYDELFISGTFGGECLSIAAAIATIKKLNEMHICEKIHKTGEHLISKLNSINSKHLTSNIISVTGLPFWFSLNFSDYKGVSANIVRTRYLELMFENGIFHNGTFAPTLTLENHIENVCDAYEQSIKIIKCELESNSILSNLSSKVIEPVFSVRSNKS